MFKVEIRIAAKIEITGGRPGKIYEAAGHYKCIDLPAEIKKLNPPEKALVSAMIRFISGGRVFRQVNKSPLVLITIRSLE